MKQCTKSLLVMLSLSIMPQPSSSMSNITMWFPSKQKIADIMKKWQRPSLKTATTIALLGLTVYTVYMLPIWRSALKERVYDKETKRLSDEIGILEGEWANYATTIDKVKKQILSMAPCQIGRQTEMESLIAEQLPSLQDKIHTLNARKNILSAQMGWRKRNELHVRLQQLSIRVENFQKSFENFTQAIRWWGGFFVSLAEIKKNSSSFADRIAQQSIESIKQELSKLMQNLEKTDLHDVKIIKRYVLRIYHPEEEVVWGDALLKNKQAMIKSLNISIELCFGNVERECTFDIVERKNPEVPHEVTQKYLEEYKTKLAIFYKILFLLKKAGAQSGAS